MATTQVLDVPTLDDLLVARRRIQEIAVHTPIIPLETDDVGPNILLKLESFQPIGSFKLRGAANAMLAAGEDALQRGVFTASAGNMAQGVAWNARRLGIDCVVVVPDSAPRNKIQAVRRLGAEVIAVPWEDWWSVMITHQFRDLDSYFIHPVCNPHVVAGNASVGFEIAEDVPDFDAVVVPYGGGGLSCGIAAALRRLGKEVPVFAAEVETAAPFAAALAHGAPRTINRVVTFIDGIGGQSVLPEMWPMAKSLLAGSIVVSVDEIKSAIRDLMEQQHVIAEGAGGAAVAAARTGKAGSGTVVCVISGGNIDLEVLAEIIQGET